MKEFELRENDEFFEPIGRDIVPEDSDEDIYLKRDQIIDNVKARIEEHLNNHRLIEIYINLEFAADNNVSNFINLTYHPQE